MNLVKSYMKEEWNQYTVAIDSTLLKAKGYVWYKSSMKKVRRSEIDTDINNDTNIHVGILRN